MSKLLRPVRYLKLRIPYLENCVIAVSALAVCYVFAAVKKICPVGGLEWPRGFQEVKVPRFRDNGTGWW